MSERLKLELLARLLEAVGACGYADLLWSIAEEPSA